MAKLITRQSRTQRQRGIASLEFAMILPLMLLLLFGLMEWGWVMHRSGQVLNAARDGARVGARPDATNAQVQAVINTRMAAAGITGFTTSITPGANFGDQVAVIVTVPYANVELIGFPLVPVPTNLVHEVRMSKEGP
jgi:Flp pilus assembly protein TadG